MPAKSDFLKVIDNRDSDGGKDRRDESQVLPGGGVQSETGFQRGPFVFRPLTAEEKSEFMKSLGTKGKGLLNELMGGETPSKTTAA